MSKISCWFFHSLRKPGWILLSQVPSMPSKVLGKHTWVLLWSPQELKGWRITIIKNVFSHEQADFYISHCNPHICLHTGKNDMCQHLWINIWKWALTEGFLSPQISFPVSTCQHVCHQNLFCWLWSVIGHCLLWVIRYSIHTRRLQ